MGPHTFFQPESRSNTTWLKLEQIRISLVKRCVLNSYVHAGRKVHCSTRCKYVHRCWSWNTHHMLHAGFLSCLSRSRCIKELHCAHTSPLIWLLKFESINYSYWVLLVSGQNAWPLWAEVFNSSPEHGSLFPTFSVHSKVSLLVLSPIASGPSLLAQITWGW